MSSLSLNLNPLAPPTPSSNALTATNNRSPKKTVGKPSTPSVDSFQNNNVLIPKARSGGEFEISVEKLIQVFKSPLKPVLAIIIETNEHSKVEDNLKRIYNRISEKTVGELVTSGVLTEQMIPFHQSTIEISINGDTAKVITKHEIKPQNTTNVKSTIYNESNSLAEYCITKIDEAFLNMLIKGYGLEETAIKPKVAN